VQGIRLRFNCKCAKAQALLENINRCLIFDEHPRRSIR